MDNYFSDFETIAVAVLGTVILAFALFGWRRLFYLAFAALVIVSGFFVNPVVEGTGAIFEKTLAKEIQKIDQQDPGKVWLSEDELYN
ncbi:hypothetical protein, partial [Escherichia coli]|nr:hypothetical protein [Escherichia coli]